MHKLVIVINGSGGVGKDSICSIVGKHYSTMNISSVDPIKKLHLKMVGMAEKTKNQENSLQI